VSISSLLWRYARALVRQPCGSPKCFGTGNRLNDLYHTRCELVVMLAEQPTV